MPHPFVRYHLPAFVWATLLAVVMLWQPPSVTGVTSGPIWWAFSLSSVEADVAMHVAVFTVMGWLAWRSLRQLGADRIVLAAALGTFLYGTLLEVLQHLTPGRALEVRDLVANGFAGWAGAWVAARLDDISL